MNEFILFQNSACISAQEKCNGLLVRSPQFCVPTLATHIRIWLGYEPTHTTKRMQVDNDGDQKRINNLACPSTQEDCNSLLQPGFLSFYILLCFVLLVSGFYFRQVNLQHKISKAFYFRSCSYVAAGAYEQRSRGFAAHKLLVAVNFVFLKEPYGSCTLGGGQL